MKISEGERDIRCRMNSLSGWKKQPEQIQAWPEMEPLPVTFAMTGRNALSTELIKPTGEQAIA